jgi:hypothetical protein
MAKIVTRGSKVYFSFTFYDENGDEAVVTSADLQLTYAGDSAYETETIALIVSDGEWHGEWDSTAARPGWVEYHAHAVAGGGSAHFATDGRFKLTGNRAGMDHDRLPNGRASSDYGFRP